MVPNAEELMEMVPLLYGTDDEYVYMGA